MYTMLSPIYSRESGITKEFNTGFLGTSTYAILSFCNAAAIRLSSNGNLNAYALLAEFNNIADANNAFSYNDDTGLAYVGNKLIFQHDPARYRGIWVIPGLSVSLYTANQMVNVHMAYNAVNSYEARNTAWNGEFYGPINPGRTAINNATSQVVKICFITYNR